MMTGGTAFHESTDVHDADEGVLDCLSIGYGDRRYHDDSPWLAPTDFGLYYVTKGRGRLETAHYGNLTLKPGDFFFRKRGEHSRLMSSERPAGWWIYWVIFRGTALRAWEGSLLPRHHVVLHIGPDQRVSDLFDRLVGVMRFHLAGHREEASSLLHRILTVAYLANLRRSTKTKDVFSALISAMQEAVRQPSYDVEEFCRKAKIAYGTLRRQFREHTGRSPHQYFLDLKLAEARSLLLEQPDLTVTEIGYHLGYDDPHYFTRLFTKKEGVAPGQFRETRRND